MPSPEPTQPQPKRAATFTTSTHPSDLAPSTTSSSRFRAPRRKSSAQSLNSSHSRSPAPRTHPLDRRASTFSLSSIDELGQSLAEDLINPSFTRRRPGREEQDDEGVTNWHSTPLLFALLPAVGGVLFKEGAAVVTDLLILGLAAIFLNWSVRLPWDWYYAAQAVVREARGRGREVAFGRPGDEEVIVEEGEDEVTGEAMDGDDVDLDEASPHRSTDTQVEGALSDSQMEAMSDLRTQETFALLSTFVFPALAAYLLHVLRGSLSKPSTGLVSDYNLSVFLLVAEIRPCRQLIRLIKRRTLHLQRTITGSDDPFGFGGSDGQPNKTIQDLAARLTELEERLQKQSDGETNGNVAKKSHFDELAVEMKKRYESRIDALERAVRRYEKRTTTLAMVTEQRLKAIDARLSDTLSLAAVAAQQSSQRSAGGRMLDAVFVLVMLPVQIVAFVVMWPVRVLEDVYARVRALLFGKPRNKIKKRAGVSEGMDMKGRDWDADIRAGRKPDGLR